MLTPNTLLQGRYQVLDSLGSGGFATVYLAQDSRLGGRRVAIKEFNPANLPPADQGWATTAFEQEAMVLGQLSHPGIATVMDFFQSTGLEYLVMEYVPGETLEQAWQQAPGHRFSEEQVLAWVEQICSVLDYLHGQNPPVIFRDLKPSNVIVRPDGMLKLVDFGIARYFKPGQTRDTHTLGTPGYAAPEQYGTGQADARTDVYTLGALTHQLLTGHDPSQTPFSFPPVAQLAPDVSPGAAAAVSQALQTAPLQRFATAGEFGRAMRESTTVLPSTIAKPVNLTAVATIGVLVVVIALAVILISRLYSEDSTVTPGSTSVGHSTPADTSSVHVKTEELDTPSGALTGDVGPQETLPPTAPPTSTTSATPTHTSTSSWTVSASSNLMVQAARDRNDAGLEIARGDRVTIEYVSGSWRAGPLPVWPLVGPEGDEQVSSKATFPVSDACVMSLVAGVGDQRPFLVGERVEFESTDSGRLWLGANDDDFADNDGSIIVNITILSLSDAAPTPPPSGRIVFSSKRDGDYEIFIMDGDGSNQTQLTFNNVEDNYPAVSPDGSLISFLSRRDANCEIYAMNLDGSAQRRLTYDGGSDRLPNWSPDGRQLVFNSDRNGDFEVYFVDLDGSNLRQVTHNSLRDGHTSWSVDDLIVLNAGQNNSNTWEIYVMDLDGNIVRQLTYNDTNDWAPNWSPDGRSIVFLSRRYNEDPAVFVMDQDGSRQREIYNSNGYEWGAVYSADGDFVFTTDKDGQDEIYRMNADGSGVARLTYQGGSYPSWVR